MAIQLSVAARNARLDEIWNTIMAGTSPRLLILSGALPANCAASDPGTILANIPLTVGMMAAAASGAKSKAGTWEDTSANATGTAAHFRLECYESGSYYTCHMQGTITATGGGGDMEVTSVSFTSGQKFEVDTFTLTDGNA